MIYLHFPFKLLGLLKDVYFTYEYSFYLGGAAMFLSGVSVLFPLRHIIAKEAAAKAADKYLAKEQGENAAQT